MECHPKIRNYWVNKKPILHEAVIHFCCLTCWFSQLQPAFQIVTAFQGLLSHRNCSNDCSPGGFLNEVGMVWSLCGTFKATSWEWGHGSDLQQTKLWILSWLFLVWKMIFLLKRSVIFRFCRVKDWMCFQFWWWLSWTQLEDQILWCEDLLQWVNLDPAEAQVSVRWDGNRRSSFWLESYGLPKLSLKTLSLSKEDQIILAGLNRAIPMGTLQDRSIHLCYKGDSRAADTCSTLHSTFWSHQWDTPCRGCTRFGQIQIVTDGENEHSNDSSRDENHSPWY